MSLGKLLEKKSIFHIWLYEKNTYFSLWPTEKNVGNRFLILHKENIYSTLSWKLNMVYNVSGKEEKKILLFQYEGNSCPCHTRLEGRGKIQKERKYFQSQGKTGIRGQRHALWLSLEMLIDTNNDDEYVDFMNHASW